MDVNDRVEKEKEHRMQFELENQRKWAAINEKLRTERAAQKRKSRAEYMRLYRKRQKSTDVANVSPQQKEDVIDLASEDLTIEDVQEVIGSLAGKDIEADEVIIGVKPWKRRPDNWKTIARHFEVFDNIASTMKCYAEELRYLRSLETQRVTIYRWCTQLKKERSPKHVQHGPVYGKAIDAEVLRGIHQRIEAGLTCDDNILREIVSLKLSEKGLLGLLKCNGGKYTFGASWCARFWKRHKLVSRVATTKMRELPDDFDQKVATYVDVGAKVLLALNIPPELVVGCDETNVQLVPRAKRTRTKEGTKRVRVLGVGSEKPQITVTLAITEAGNVLPCQFIFQGKTTATLPDRGRQRPPEGSIFCFSESHWQTVQTYKEYIDKILVPYRLKTIEALHLQDDQWMLLKHDLHFTHTDASVQEYLEQRKIKSLYVPGKCTDALQECDTVLNKPFKSGCKDGFTAYLHQLFDDHCTKNVGMSVADIVGSFRPALTVGKLKPMLPSFVSSGLNKLTTPEMSVTIRHAFAVHGHFKEMREIAEVLRNNTDSMNTVIPSPQYLQEVEFAQSIDRIGILEDDDIDSDDEAFDLQRDNDEDGGDTNTVSEENEDYDFETEDLNANELVIKLGVYGRIHSTVKT